MELDWFDPGSSATPAGHRSKRRRYSPAGEDGDGITEVHFQPARQVRQLGQRLSEEHEALG